MEAISKQKRARQGEKNASRLGRVLSFSFFPFLSLELHRFCRVAFSSPRFTLLHPASPSSTLHIRTLRKTGEDMVTPLLVLLRFYDTE